MHRPIHAGRFGGRRGQNIVSGRKQHRGLADPGGRADVLAFAVKRPADLDRAFAGIRIENLVDPQEPGAPLGVVDDVEPVFDEQLERRGEVGIRRLDQAGEERARQRRVVLRAGQDGAGEDPTLIGQEVESI